MPSTNRRSVLAALGTVAFGGAAGCSTSGPDDVPAGSLRFENEHDVPHAFTMRVSDVGTSHGDEPDTVDGDPVVRPGQRDLSASTVVEPGETRTYETAFTEPVWYAVQFTVDGEIPDVESGRVTWKPAPEDDGRGSFLSGRVVEAGEFSWVVTSTDDAGPFDG